MKTTNPSSRHFVDLIRKVSPESVWPNWEGSIINVGDYGTINNESGALVVEGNIYDSGFQTSLDEQGLEIDLKLFQPQKNPVVVDMLIISPGVEQFHESIPCDTLFQAGFRFQKGKRGAVLIMHKPQQEFIPLNDYLHIITEATKLRGKYLVTSTFRCPGHYIYLSSGSKERLKVVFTDSRRILPQAAGECMQWWNSGEKTQPRKEYVPDDQCRFTSVLYNLHHIQNKNVVQQSFRREEEEETESTPLLPKMEPKMEPKPKPKPKIQYDSMKMKNFLTDL